MQLLFEKLSKHCGKSEKKSPQSGVDGEGVRDGQGIFSPSALQREGGKVQLLHAPVGQTAVGRHPLGVGAFVAAEP